MALRATCGDAPNRRSAGGVRRLHPDLEIPARNRRRAAAAGGAAASKSPIRSTLADPGPKSEPASGDFVFVGRIAREKGPLLFAEGARRAGIAPVFVGDGPIAGELAAAYPEARILGWKPKAEVLAAMRAARALVFPSLWYEGQPLTVMEAKAMGTPVVVSEGCAGREEIEDGVAGLWFANGDADSLAAALTRLKDDAFVSALSAGAYRAFWSNPPTLGRHVEAVLGVYECALARAAAPADAA